MQEKYSGMLWDKPNGELRIDMQGPGNIEHNTLNADSQKKKELTRTNNIQEMNPGAGES